MVEGGTMNVAQSGPPAQVTLREVADADLPVFFAQQLDPDANRMAAFISKDPADREAFFAHWARIRADTGITLRAIEWGEHLAGYVSVHGWFGEPEITYWLGREFWGQGIATRALALFLQVVPTRPLSARVAKDNLGSLRVLQKCGFTIRGEDRGFSNARGVEVEEWVLALD
jgi:RimJ/RimL family protein N-acetyltransferase